MTILDSVINKQLFQISMVSSKNRLKTKDDFVLNSSLCPHKLYLSIFFIFCFLHIVTSYDIYQNIVQSRSYPIVKLRYSSDYKKLCVLEYRESNVPVLLIYNFNPLTRVSERIYSSGLQGTVDGRNNPLYISNGGENVIVLSSRYTYGSPPYLAYIKIFNYNGNQYSQNSFSLSMQTYPQAILLNRYANRIIIATVSSIQIYRYSSSGYGLLHEYKLPVGNGIPYIKYIDNESKIVAFSGSTTIYMFDVASDYITLLDQKSVGQTNDFVEVSDDQKYISVSTFNQIQFNIYKIDLQTKKFIPLNIPNKLQNFNSSTSGTFSLIFNNQIFQLYNSQQLVVYRFQVDQNNIVTLTQKQPPRQIVSAYQRITMYSMFAYKKDENFVGLFLNFRTYNFNNGNLLIVQLLDNIEAIPPCLSKTVINTKGSTIQCIPLPIAQYPGPSCLNYMVVGKQYICASCKSPFSLRYIANPENKPLTKCIKVESVIYETKCNPNTIPNGLSCTQCQQNKYIAIKGNKYPQNSFLNQLQIVLPKCTKQSSVLCSVFGSCRDI